MMSRFSALTSSSKRNNSEKIGESYERDSARLQRTNPAARSNPHDRYAGSFAPNPAFIKFIRFFLYAITSMSALATAGVGLGVAHYYNTHKPVVVPSWGSLIACIVFGIATPGVLFGMFLVTPKLFRHGGVGAILNQTRLELVMLFNLSVIWISGSIALACDLRGRENCIWDGYYHYPKPSDFNYVCNLVNVSVALAYTTFGLCAIQMVVIYTVAIYILLFLDQEVLTEPTNDMGGRAYRARTLALAQHQTLLNAEKSAVSTAGPYMSERSTSGGAGPMAGGAASSRSLPRRSSDGGMGGGRRYQDEEEEHDEKDHEHEESDDGEEDVNAGGYYGFDGPAGRLGHGRV